VFPHLGSNDISFSSYYLNDKYVELKYRKKMQLKSSICQAKGWFQKTQEFLNDLEKGFWSGKIERGVYCQAKGWFQKTQEFSNDLKKGFWSGKMEGEKIDSHEKVLKMFSPLKMLNSPFSKERDFLSFSSFISLFYAPSLLRMNSEIFEMFVEKKIQTFFQMGWKWLHQDLWNWGSCKKIIDGGCISLNGLMHANKFWVRLAAKFCEGKINLKNSKAQEELIP
jgi:hypothetical protein